MSQDTISIRFAEERDIPRVAHLYREWEGEATTLGLRADSEQDLIAKLRGWFLVACHEGEVVGFITGDTHTLAADEWVVCPAGGRYLHVEDLYVTPTFRDRRIGSTLMKRLMNLAKAEHVDHVAVYSSSQPWSRIASFYESLGLRVWFVQMYGEIPGDST